MGKNGNHHKNKETKYFSSFIMINQNYLTFRLKLNTNFRKKNKDRTYSIFKTKISKKIDKIVIYLDCI